MDVSVIVPVYNVSDYIERCLKSIMRQNFSGALECVLVDDVTPDDSIIKCEGLLKSYTGPISFKIVRHEKNLGLSGARNTGINESCGRYLYFLDSDDEISTDCITSLYSIATKHPKVQVVQGGIKSEPYRSYYDDTSYLNVEYIDNNSWLRREYFRMDGINTNAWNKLVLRSFLIENDLFFKVGLIHEDQMWMYKVVKVLQHYAMAHEKTYVHYSTPNSIMTSMSNDVDLKSCKAWDYIFRQVAKTIDEPYAGRQLVYYTSILMQRYKGFSNYKELLDVFSNVAKERKLYFSRFYLSLFKHVTSRRIRFRLSMNFAYIQLYFEKKFGRML